MKKAINWFFRGTYIWHALLGIISISVYAMTGQSTPFFKILGLIFGLFFATSLVYSIIVETKESKEADKYKEELKNKSSKK